MLNYLARILLIGSLMEALWLLSFRLSPLRSHGGLFVALMISIFGLCCVSFFCCPLKNRRAVLCVLAFALLFRLSVLPAPPDQSEDVYRYLWDGRLALLGIDPFRYPPNAPELEPYRDSQLYPMLNSKPYITVYPPLSQALFRLSYTMFGSATIPMKAIFSLLEFGSLILMWRLLTNFKASLQPLFFMAWNPFFIFEFSHSGHSDSSMIFLVLLSIYLLHKGLESGAMAGYAGAILAKLHPLLWLPLFLRRVGWRANLIFLAVMGTGLLLYLSPGTWILYLQSLRLYFRLFEFNAGIHYLLRYIGKAGFGQEWDKLTGPYLACALVLITALIVWRFPIRDARGLLHAGFWIMTADLCLATTVHPWYLSWAALAIPLFPYAFMIYWTGAGFLSYIAYSYSPVYEPSWALLIEYLPMYALLVWEIYRREPLLAPRLHISELPSRFSFKGMTCENETAEKR
jgi:alpha-1,6-mannosyltransferase